MGFAQSTRDNDGQEQTTPWFAEPGEVVELTGGALLV
tara:strand:- start:25189 stop:25299 length:111 start_codon:yes stop_codon:yes gene_type:complete